MIWARLGAALMFTSVALGAFAAHGLKNKLPPDMLAVFETGVRYQVYHALALFVVSWLSSLGPNAAARNAGLFFVSGILIFSGSLYILAISGVRAWGMVTPLGGLFFLIGWAFLFWGARSLSPI